MGVEESDEGDDGVGDDVSSEKLSPGGCQYEGLSESVGLVSLLHVRVRVRVRVPVQVRVRELRVAGIPKPLRSARSSRDSCWSVEIDCMWERVREWDLWVVDASVSIDPLLSPR